VFMWLELKHKGTNKKRNEEKGEQEEKEKI
jgi:hypothetical protein